MTNSSKPINHSLAHLTITKQLNNLFAAYTRELNQNLETLKQPNLELNLLIASEASRRLDTLISTCQNYKQQILADKLTKTKKELQAIKDNARFKG